MESKSKKLRWKIMAKTTNNNINYLISKGILNELLENKVITLLAPIPTLYKKAICAQIDFLSINGTDSLNETATGGFTVGKVTVHAKASNGSAGKMAESISPLAISYLEQTGLMNPQIPTIEGWW